ncbi:hypothetical protein K7432_001110 [Basidiobolus ranarum]|uniref:Uncharacterized protein n=1 Tax=Basidiobolus ranarum TaxID=34480 RepID=A0ABR2WA66_9FUNG
MHFNSFTTSFITLLLVLGARARNKCDTPGDDKFTEKISEATRKDVAQFEIKYENNVKIIKHFSLNTEIRLVCDSTTATDPNTLPLGDEKTTIVASLESIGFLELLNSVERISSIEGTDRSTSPCVIKQIEKNITASEKPLMFSNTSKAGSITLGIKDSMSPLEKAQWILYVGAILNMDKEAEDIYNKIKNSYNCHRDNLSKINKKPIAWIHSDKEGYKFKDDNYHRILISDAGGSPVKPTKNPLTTPVEFQNDMAKTWLAIDETYLTDINMVTWLAAYNLTSKASIPLLESEGLYRTDKIKNEALNSDWDQSAPSRPDLAIQELISAQYRTYQPDYNNKWITKLATGYKSDTVESSQCSNIARQIDIPSCTAKVFKVDETAADSGSSKTSKSNTGAIVGGVVGGIIGVLAIGGIAFYGRKKYLQSGSQSDKKPGWDFISLKSGRSTASLA